MAYKTIRKAAAMGRSSRSFRPVREVAHGIYEERIAHPAAVRTGIVDGESHEFFAVMTAEIMALVDRLYVTDRYIEARWQQLSEQARQMCTEGLIASELERTQAIEGVRSTWKETVHAVEAVKKPRKKTAPLQSMATAYFVVRMNAGQVRNLRDVRAFYDVVMHDELREDIALETALFRSGNVMVIDAAYAEPAHRGVAGETVEAYMKQWLRFTRDKRVPALVRAVMSHFLFEYIHPFYDGNGRTGRFVLALQLREILSAPTALLVSSAIASQKEGYYKAFETAEHPLNCAELTLFVRDILECIASAQSALRDQFDKNALAFETVQQLSASEIIKLFMTFDIYGYKPEGGLTIADIAHSLDMNRNRVAAELEVLVREGVVVKQPGSGQRAARYCFERYSRGDLP